MVAVKILIALTLGYILYQDVKYRAVYWFLFPVSIALLGTLHFFSVATFNFFNAVFINLLTLGFIFSILFMYNRVFIKKDFFNEVFGLGDLLFFLAFAVAFPTVTFIIIFVFSLLFSLVAWLLVKNYSRFKSVPLAGYMAVFLMIILGANWVTQYSNLYLL